VGHGDELIGVRHCGVNAAYTEKVNVVSTVDIGGTQQRATVVVSAAVLRRHPATLALRVQRLGYVDHD
jgi:hypothetical protein